MAAVSERIEKDCGVDIPTQEQLPKADLTTKKERTLNTVALASIGATIGLGIGYGISAAGYPQAARVAWPLGAGAGWYIGYRDLVRIIKFHPSATKTAPQTPLNDIPPVPSPEQDLKPFFQYTDPITNSYFAYNIPDTRLFTRVFQRCVACNVQVRSDAEMESRKDFFRKSHFMFTASIEDAFNFMSSESIHEGSYWRAFMLQFADKQAAIEGTRTDLKRQILGNLGIQNMMCLPCSTKLQSLAFRYTQAGKQSAYYAVFKKYFFLNPENPAARTESSVNGSAT